MNARAAGYAAAIWAFVFAVLHVIWAAGWYVGLNEQLAREAFQKRSFLIYDLAVTVVCVIGTGVALALARGSYGRFASRTLILLGGAGAAILTLRGSAGVAQVAYLLFLGRQVTGRVVFWELWFCLGALLYALAVVAYDARPHQMR